MGSDANPYTIWEKSMLKKQVVNGQVDVVKVGEEDRETEPKNHKKAILTFFIALIFIFGVSLFFFQSSKIKKESNQDIVSQEEPKASIFENLINSVRGFSLFQTSLSGKIQNFTLGEEEKISMSSLKYVPDGHISKIEKNGNTTLFISAHDRSYLMQGKNLKSLQFLTDNNSFPKPVLMPELTGFDKDYAGFGQVIENPKTGDLMGIYHTEIRINPDASGSQLTSIALAISKDGGFNWKKIGQIITGQNIASVGTAVSGAGQPCAVIVGDYIYLYYSDWNRQMPDSIHLARALLDGNGMPGTWEKYTESGFTSYGLGGKSTPVILPPSFEKPIYYTANPSVSYNTYIKKFLAIVETNIGFFAVLSTDGITWDSPRLIFEFSKDTTIPKNFGDIWYSYPSLISEGTESDMITGKKGYLYYGKGIFGQDHQLVRRSFTLQ